MKKKNSAVNYVAKKIINMEDKAHRDYWLMHWCISIHQFRAAVGSTNCHEVKVIREELRRKGAV